MAVTIPRILAYNSIFKPTNYVVHLPNFFVK